MIILWGNNLAETDVPDMRFVLDAREGTITSEGVTQLNPNGTTAKVVNIDPRYTSTATLSDQWISIRPGTDGALALSMINVIINEQLHNVRLCDELHRWLHSWSGKIRSSFSGKRT